MSQVSYGTIAITDLTDIKDMYLQYCMAVGSITTAAVIEAKTIWTSPEVNWFTLTADTTVNSNKRYYRLSSGDYYVVTPIGSENPSSNGWYEDTAYPSWQSGYQIWIREVRIKEGIELPEYGTPYLDKAVNQINARIKKIWSNSTGSYMASGIGSNEVDINDSSTYGFNSKTTTTGISFNYNNYKTIELDGNIPALKFYEPSKTSQGTQTVQIDSNGMKLLKGGIIGGGVGSSYVPQDDFLYLSTQNYDSYLNVAGSGFRKNWRLVIGKYFGITEGGNAYLNGATVSGKIVALTGQIGGTYVGDSWGWTLGTGKLYSGTMGSDNSLHMRTFDLSTDEAISFNGSDLRSDWRLTVGSKFGVTKTGEIFATDANLSGIIKANEGSIGGANGWTISSQEIKSTNYDITDSGSIYLSTKDLTTAKTINGQSRTDWRFTIGDKFGVTSDGYLHADGLNITNITAESLNIGPVVKYYVCDTAAATQAKTIDNVPNFTLTIGMVINVTFTYGNTNSQPTLNINNTGAKSIMKPSSSGATNLSYYEYNFATSNTVRTFRYDGTYWVLQDDGAGNARSSASSAAYTAYNYITKIDNAGIFISPYNQSPSTSSPGNSVKIDGKGMIVYNDGIAIAQYGVTAIIGQINNGKSRVEITEKGIDFYNRTSDVDAPLAHIGFDTGIAEGGGTSSSKYPYYTFGLRKNDTPSTRGNYSVAEGYNTTASGYCSHAEGFYTSARGAYSHAEGDNTAAQGEHGSHAEGENTAAIGESSHAEGSGTSAIGLNSHAEGDATITMGRAAHTEGLNTFASGVCSHAQNHGTRVSKTAQTAIGTYNIEDTSSNKLHPHPDGDAASYGKYAFIIGNGSQNTRSNALTVDWNGNIKAGGLDCGKVSITPVADKVTSKAVTFSHTFSSAPNVVATAESAYPNAVSEVTVSNITTTGFTMNLLRTTNQVTNIFWIAMYCG